MHRIIAKFKFGQKATFSMDVFELLKSDPDVEWIIDADAEALLYMAEDFGR